jgi:hypothetical protein
LSAPPILREVYREYMKRFGEPATSIVFDQTNRNRSTALDDLIQPGGIPDRIEVFIWEPDHEHDVTMFLTIGMAVFPLPKVTHRAELHFAVRKPLTHEEQHAVSCFLANLAVYPFHHGEPLDWWHTMSNPGEIPLYSTAKCLLLGRYTKKGWDNKNGWWDLLTTDEGDIRILTVVPITQQEKDLGGTVGLGAIRERLDAIDIFTPR